MEQVMIQMVNRQNMTPIGQDRKTLTLKALLYLNVTVYMQVCRLFCMLYIPLLSLVQARPWFRSSMWISSIFLKYSARLVTSTTHTYLRMYDILQPWTTSCGDVQMFDRPNTTPIGQDGKNTFKVFISIFFKDIPFLYKSRGGPLLIILKESKAFECQSFPILTNRSCVWPIKHLYHH